MKYLFALAPLFLIAPVAAQCNEVFFHDFEGAPPAGVTETFDGLWHKTLGCAPNAGCGTGTYLRYGVDAGCGSCGQPSVWVSYSIGPIALPAAAPLLLEYCSSYGAESFCDFNCGQVVVNGVAVYDEVEWIYPRSARRIIDISTFAGQAVTVEFRFFDLDLLGCASEFGWGVDDLRIVTWDPNPVGSGYCPSNVNSTGTGAAIRAYGSDGVADNNLFLATFNVPGDTFGYYLMSPAQAFVPLFGGSQGNLCLGLPIVRHNLSVLRSSSSGRLVYCVDLLDLPQGQVFGAGDTWNFQSWFRDWNPGATSNTSDGVSITWQ